MGMSIEQGYTPGALGRVVELHGTYYGLQWGFGVFFEAKVAVEMAAFLNRFDEGRDGLWTAMDSGRVEGAIVLDGLHGRDQGAHLRWFIVSDASRGTGVGGRLIRSAMTFCRARGYQRVYLWTFQGLDAARHLYEKEGFTLVESRSGKQWGVEVLEQRFECWLSAVG